MNTITTAQPNIEQEEGLRLAVYDDANGQPIVSGTQVQGNPTIGYGRLLTSAHGITKAEALYLLANDLAEARGDVAGLPAFAHLNTPRRAALLDMDFNMGIDTLLQFHTFLGYLLVGNYEAAYQDLLGTWWYQQLESSGRSARIAQIIRTGVWVPA